MRLLDDDGVPCGSIAVSARADGRAYTPQQEHMLDALAQRVSSTLHRLSLFTEVQAERRTLADVVGSSSDGIFSVGVDHAVRSWNPAMARITGVTETDALGHAVSTVFRVVDEEGRPRHGGRARGRGGPARPRRRRGALAHLQLVAPARGGLRGRGPRRDRAQAPPGRQGRVDRAGQPRAAHAAHAHQGLPPHAAAPRGPARAAPTAAGSTRSCSARSSAWRTW